MPGSTAAAIPIPPVAEPVLLAAHARRPHLHRRRRRRSRAHRDRFGAGRLRIRRRRRPTDGRRSTRAGGRRQSSPAGQPYVIRWTATAGSAPITHVRPRLLAPTTARHLHPIAECDNVRPSARSVPVEQPDRRPNRAGSASRATRRRDGQTERRTSAASRFAPRHRRHAADRGWVHADVGNVGAAGSATYDGFVYDGEGFTVTGSGADIWGTADEFHFVWQHMSRRLLESTRASTRCRTSNAWTKAGLMIRANATDASSAHASIFVSPAQGHRLPAAHERRRRERRARQGRRSTAPVWLRLTRQGDDRDRAATGRTSTDPWTMLGRQIDRRAQRRRRRRPRRDQPRRRHSSRPAKFVGVYRRRRSEALDVDRRTAATGGGSAGDGTIFTVDRIRHRHLGHERQLRLSSAVPIGDSSSITVRVRSHRQHQRLGEGGRDDPRDR